eukprot:gene44118-59744_t
MGEIIAAEITDGEPAGSVKAQAEAEGLAAVFSGAGFEWRQPGCSMCLAMNGDLLAPGTRCASTTNRNFEGRQGRGAITHLMSPAMAAAAAVTGRITDVPHAQSGAPRGSQLGGMGATVAGRMAALRIANLDTDQIMPKQFLRGIDKSGLAPGLLYDLRFD